MPGQEDLRPAANTSAAQEMSRRHQIHAGLVAAIAAPPPGPGCVPDDGNHSPFC